MHKHEIALALGRSCGYRDYLEVCTPVTGLTFARVDKEQFPVRTRIMYRCPREFSDGEPLHLATDSTSSEVLFREWRRLALGEKYPFFDANRSRLLNLIPPGEFRCRLAAES